MKSNGIPEILLSSFETMELLSGVFSFELSIDMKHM